MEQSRRGMRERERNEKPRALSLYVYVCTYLLVRRLCHDSRYQSLHSKPTTLPHTSSFSSHRKGIRSQARFYLRNFFRSGNRDTGSAPIHLLLLLLPLLLRHNSSSTTSFISLYTSRAVHPHTRPPPPSMPHKIHTQDHTLDLYQRLFPRDSIARELSKIKYCFLSQRVFTIYN